MSKRPYPPQSILALDAAETFIRAEDAEVWIHDLFLDSQASLFNPDHSHLEPAFIGVLWTNIANSRQMRPVVGTAEIPKPHNALSGWVKARAKYQMEQWFGAVPDFVITLYAPYADQIEDREFCALIEHEMYHCAQKRDGFGMPKFRKDGKPAYGIRGHDVEEFVGIVKRYGVDAAAGLTKELVEAAQFIPAVSASRIAGACGTCARLAG